VVLLVHGSRKDYDEWKFVKYDEKNVVPRA
jgi:hypothetical protein